MNWIKQALLKITPKQRDELHKNTWIGPSGRASFADKCSMCGRLPHAYEDPFMIYGTPVCEDCFWSDEFEELHSEVKQNE